MLSSEAQKDKEIRVKLKVAKDLLSQDDTKQLKEDNQFDANKKIMKSNVNPLIEEMIDKFEEM